MTIQILKCQENGQGMSGKCKGKEALQRVYIAIETTWNSQKVVQAGRQADTRLFHHQGEVLSALATQQTIRAFTDP